MSILCRCLFLVIFARFCTSARILGIFLVPSYSHQIVFQPIYKELSLRGHKVIVLTPNPLNDTTLTNLTEIDTSYTYKYSSEALLLDPNDYRQMRTWGASFMSRIIVDVLEDEKFKTIYQDPEKKFDLVLVEGYSPLVQAFGYKFNAPEIPVYSLDATLDMHSAMGNIIHPGLYGGALLEYEYPISMWRKIKNSYLILWDKWFAKYRELPMANKIAKTYFGEDFPSISTLAKNLSMVIISRNKFMSSARPVAPTLIQVEFMHVKPPQRLPQELDEIMNNSTQGVVYFSLGSNVKSAGLPPPIRNSIIAGLSALPYTVLWKWESDEVPDVGENVITRKWFPQQDILAHPNTKVFVTQGGLQSIEEAICRAVPMVGIPIIVDQISNVEKLVKLGIAVKLALPELNAESLKEAIIGVAENSRYLHKMKEIRDISFDEPMTGLQKAIWWCEYMIRYKGAPHLRSAMADTPLYEYLMLDVIGVVLGMFVLFIFIVRLISRLLFKIVYKYIAKVKFD